MITVGSQYTTVLAYCVRFSDAKAEMARLEPYEAGLPLLLKKSSKASGN